jgi:DNA-binding response OmpR family regulator
MNRILVIDQDRAAMEKIGLACLEIGVGCVMADNVCEGVRVLLGDSVSLVLVDSTELRFGARESARLFERVAPGIPVIVMARPEMDVARIVTLELAGFRVVTKPVVVSDLFAKVAAEVAARG